VGPF